MNNDDCQVKRGVSFEDTTEINLIFIYRSMDKWKDLYYQLLFDLNVKDTIAVIFDLIYEVWSFHDWIDYVWDLSHSLIILSIVEYLTFIALRTQQIYLEKPP